MFKEGTKVRCTVVDDETADGKHMPSMALLKQGAIYTVDDYQGPEECRDLYPDQPYLMENGGKIMLRELPGLVFFPRRFETVAAA